MKGLTSGETASSDFEVFDYKDTDYIMTNAEQKGWLLEGTNTTNSTFVNEIKELYTNGTEVDISNYTVNGALQEYNKYENGVLGNALNCTSLISQEIDFTQQVDIVIIRSILCPLCPNTAGYARWPMLGIDGLFNIGGSNYNYACYWVKIGNSSNDYDTTWADMYASIYADKYTYVPTTDGFTVTHYTQETSEADWTEADSTTLTTTITSGRIVTWRNGNPGGGLSISNFGNFNINDMLQVYVNDVQLTMEYTNYPVYWSTGGYSSTSNIQIDTIINISMDKSFEFTIDHIDGNQSYQFPVISKNGVFYTAMGATWAEVALCCIDSDGTSHTSSSFSFTTQGLYTYRIRYYPSDTVVDDISYTGKNIYLEKLNSTTKSVINSTSIDLSSVTLAQNDNPIILGYSEAESLSESMALGIENCTIKIDGESVFLPSFNYIRGSNGLKIADISDKDKTTNQNMYVYDSTNATVTLPTTTHTSTYRYYKIK